MRQVPTALLGITPEQREIYRQKAAAKREADKAFALEHLRNDFADKNHWRRLASHYGVILPSWYVRTTKQIRRVLNHTGLSGSWVHEATGFSSVSEWMERNPDWPTYAFVGLVLEAAHERDNFAELPVEETGLDDLI